jgi:hypothetical protein
MFKTKNRVGTYEIKSSQTDKVKTLKIYVILVKQQSANFVKHFSKRIK